MTGRPCLAGGGHRPGPVPGNLLPPLLLTKLVSPLFISCACVSNHRVLVRLACVSPAASPICICMCVRLRAPRLLRPSRESPLMPWGREAGLCFRCLELCPCFHLVEPSSRRRVADASLSTRSRAPRLLRPSSESPRYTGYQIGP